MSTEEAQNTAAAATNPGQEAYEEEHVHSVYEQIASHFSSTRYKVGIVLFVFPHLHHQTCFLQSIFPMKKVRRQKKLGKDNNTLAHRFFFSSH
jgi:hypothetical protein